MYSGSAVDTVFWRTVYPSWRGDYRLRMWLLWEVSMPALPANIQGWVTGVTSRKAAGAWPKHLSNGLAWKGRVQRVAARGFLSRTTHFASVSVGPGNAGHISQSQARL